jgi:hypothetical protein
LVSNATKHIPEKKQLREFNNNTVKDAGFGVVYIVAFSWILICL